MPHITAENMRAAGYALGFLQLEDHGEPVALGLLRARGELARYLGRDRIESDFRNRLSYARALETYHLLEEDTREIYEGFAEGVNRYIELYPEEFPEWLEPGFTGHDVHALGIGGPSAAATRSFLRRLETEAEEPEITAFVGDLACRPSTPAWHRLTDHSCGTAPASHRLRDTRAVGQL